MERQSGSGPLEPGEQDLLLDRVGGSDGLHAVVSVFYDRVLADAALAEFFIGVDIARLRAHQHRFLLAALGGPDLFTGRGLRTAHAGLAVTDDAFDRLAAHLVTALADMGVTAVDVVAVRATLERGRAAVVTASTADQSDSNESDP